VQYCQEKSKIRVEKWFIQKVPLWGTLRIVAKGLRKIEISVGEKQFNTLWRCVPDSVVFQKTSSEKYFTTSDLLI